MNIYMYIYIYICISYHLRLEFSLEENVIYCILAIVLVYRLQGSSISWENTYTCHKVWWIYS